VVETYASVSLFWRLAWIKLEYGEEVRISALKESHRNCMAWFGMNDGASYE